MLQSRAQIAVDYYVKYGYNCSQAVAVTYADLLGLDPMVCFKGMETFGSGMGARLGTCGAISGGDITDRKLHTHHFENRVNAKMR